MDLIKIEDTPNEQSLVFIVPNYIRKHALSVIVALYQQWMIEGISLTVAPGSKSLLRAWELTANILG